MNFLTSLLLLLMCRPLLTLCRRHRLGELLPIDDHVFYHKFAGVLLVFFSAVHAVMHFINIGQRRSPATTGTRGKKKPG